MVLLLLALVIGFLIYWGLKKRNKGTSTIPIPESKEFSPKVAELLLPENDTLISWHKNAITRGFSEGDLSLVNLSYAKLIESARQLNLKEHGKYENALTAARMEYEEFRNCYNMQYPPQFLPNAKSVPEPSAHYNENPHRVIRVRSNNSKLRVLIKNIGSKGHPQYPLLRKEYDVVSGMPYMDFSGWVIDQLKQNDFDSIYAFVKEFYLRGESEFGDQLKSKFERFLAIDFNALFEEIEEQAIFEIKAFFILKYGFEDFNREFWIVPGKQAEMLCKILSVYSFSINPNAFVPLMNKANKFIKEMSRDNDYWKDFEKYKKEHLKKENVLKVTSNLSFLLKQLHPGERLHFFDFAASYGKFWSGSSTYKTRSFGINEEESLKKISTLGMFDRVSDIQAIPEVADKAALKDAAEIAGFEIKKSWTLEKIFENLLKMENGRAFLEQFIENKTVLLFKEGEYRSDLNSILEYQHEIERIVDLISMV